VPVFAPNYAGGAADEEASARKSMDVGKSLLRQMDADGDGMISRDEFRAILTDVPELDSLANYDMRLMPAIDEEVKA
jgi:Ca2+-binding EF-hand superfamily protein